MPSEIRNIPKAVVLLSLLTVFAFAQSQKPKVRSVDPVLADGRAVAAKVLRSVVAVFAEDKDGKVIGQGSGFFFEQIRPIDHSKDFEELSLEILGSEADKNRSRSRKLWVATNLHVIKRASKIRIKDLATGKAAEVSSVIGFDIRHDLCVLKLKGDDFGTPLSIQSSTSVAIGDDVYAAGNPEGLEGSLSKGIVSAIRKDQHLIQIDAPISHGSSGGPVVNSRGLVIGIVVSMFAPGQNLNFAIPSEFLSKMNLRWNLDPDRAGRLGITEKERDRLRGPAKTMTTYEADVRYDAEKRDYLEKERKLREKKGYLLNGELTSLEIYSNKGLFMTQVFAYKDDGCAGSIVQVKNGVKTEHIRTTDECIKAKYNSTPINEEEQVDIENGKLVWKYDGYGNRVEERFPQTNGVRRTVSNYDKAGLLRDENVYYPEGVVETRTFDYKFDSYGNWIRRLETITYASAPQLVVPNTVIYRDISYYQY